jgi:chromosome segregation ATPase
MHSMKRTLLALVALVALPAALPAQQPQQPGAQIPENVRPLLMEMQQLHVRLEGIQQQALEDPQLSAAQDALGESIKQTMETIDPTLTESMERVQDLETEAAEAQRSGDQAKLQQLAAEAEQIQTKFLTAQEQALQQPALAAQIDSFQTQLERKMAEVDPEAQALIERFKELQVQIASVMQGG